MTEPESQPLTQKQLSLIESLFDDLPTEFDARHKAVLKIRGIFQQELARRLAPALNEYVRTQPQASLLERQTLSTWINRVLREAGLRIKSNDGDPAILIADTRMPLDADSGARFRLEFRDAKGRNRKASTTYGRLFDLELMPAPTRAEGLSRASREQLDKEHGR